MVHLVAVSRQISVCLVSVQQSVCEGVCMNTIGSHVGVVCTVLMREAHNTQHMHSTLNKGATGGSVAHQVIDFGIPHCSGHAITSHHEDLVSMHHCCHVPTWLKKWWSKVPGLTIKHLNSI